VERIHRSLDGCRHDRFHFRRPFTFGAHHGRQAQELPQSQLRPRAEVLHQFCTSTSGTTAPRAAANSKRRFSMSTTSLAFCNSASVRGSAAVSASDPAAGGAWGCRLAETISSALRPERSSLLDDPDSSLENHLNVAKDSA
jgi:hypothetical protein